jgi:hypothetical protein
MPNSLKCIKYEPREMNHDEQMNPTHWSASNMNHEKWTQLIDKHHERIMMSKWTQLIEVHQIWYMRNEPNALKNPAHWDLISFRVDNWRVELSNSIKCPT